MGHSNLACLDRILGTSFQCFKSEFYCSSGYNLYLDESYAHLKPVLKEHYAVGVEIELMNVKTDDLAMRWDLVCKNGLYVP